MNGTYPRQLLSCILRGRLSSLQFNSHSMRFVTEQMSSGFRRWFRVLEFFQCPLAKPRLSMISIVPLITSEIARHVKISKARSASDASGFQKKKNDASNLIAVYFSWISVIERSCTSFMKLIAIRIIVFLSAACNSQQHWSYLGTCQGSCGKIYNCRKNYISQVTSSAKSSVLMAS